MTGQLGCPRLPWRAAGRVALIALVVGLAACSQRAGDFGRQQNRLHHQERLSIPIDRRLMTGGAIEMSKLPLSDEERRMYDVLWRFFSAPYAAEWTPVRHVAGQPDRARFGQGLRQDGQILRLAQAQPISSRPDAATTP